MLKSLARGLEAANAGAQTSSSGQPSDMLMAFLSEGQFSAALKDIHHLHLVVYDLNSLRDAQSQAENENLLANLGTSINGDKSTPEIPAPASKIPDAIAFYETKFVAEGGKRLLMGDFKNTKVLMSGFDAPTGFALVVNAPSRIIVARADGYPDMEIVGRMVNLGAETNVPSSTASTTAKPAQEEPAS